MNLAVLLLQNNEGTLAGLLGSTLLLLLSMVGVLAILLIIAGWWKMFDKAAQPGWMALVPIFNIYFLLKIAGKPGWWLILYLVPLLNIVIHFIVAIDLGKTFKKDLVFSILLLGLFSPIGYIILGFSKTLYTGPAKPFDYYNLKNNI